jgi:hypothetical protein
VLSRFRRELSVAPEPLVYGDVLVHGNTSFARDGERYAGRFDLARLLQRNICQQAIFYRRDLFESMGGFEPRYRVCADWDLAIRAAWRFPIRWVDAVVCDFSAGGVSTRVRDDAFEVDYPGLLLRLFMRRPLCRAFISVREIFSGQARKHRNEGLFLRSLLFATASFWLRAHRKVLRWVIERQA